MEKIKKILLGVLGVVAGCITWSLVHTLLVQVFMWLMYAPLLRNLTLYQLFILFDVSLIPSCAGVAAAGFVADKIGGSARWVTVVAIITVAINVVFAIQDQALSFFLFVRWGGTILTAVSLWSTYQTSSEGAYEWH